MKFRTFALALGIAGGTLLASSSALAASWTGMDSPTVTNLYGIDCSAINSCVTVGDLGTVLYLSSSNQWEYSSSGVATFLNDVDVYSSTLAVAVGIDGVIIRSTDGGLTWASIETDFVEDLYDVAFASSTIGYAVGDGNTLIKTTDGGLTWANAAGSIAMDARSIDTVSTTTAWVAGLDGAVYVTTDGGENWDFANTGLTTSNDITTIEAISSSTAWIGANARFVGKTTTGGASWTTISTSGVMNSDEYISDIAFYTSAYGVVVGNAGHVGRFNGSTTLTAESSLLAGNFYDVATPSAGVSFAVGGAGAIWTYDAYAPDAATNFVMTNSEPTNDTTPAFTWTATTDDESSISFYEFRVDSGVWTNVGNVTTYTVPTALSSGSHTAYLRATDAAGNTSPTTSTSFNVDTTAPTVSTVSPTTAVEDSATSMYVTATDTSSIASCTLYVGSSAVGTMSYSSSAGTYAYSYTFSTSGSSSAYAVCTDTAGNSTTSTTATITISAATTTVDTTAPTVGSVSPTTATEDSAVTLSATYSDSVGVSSCTLYLNGSNVGSMTLSGGTASKSYTFTSNSSYTAYVKCSDAAGNTGTGTTVTVTVAAATTTTSEAEEGDLMKLACPGGEDVNDPCRAVYYYGDDGKRHAFPNENVFFTWYTDFDDVVTVTDDFMADVSLGANVTYHPGTTMVKFVTVNTVYAVGESGELRAIDSEDTAKSIFGSNWNTQIEDISDAFYSNYEFGEVINNTSDFDQSDVEDSVNSIDDIL